MKIILGSSSKSRQKILKEMGYDFEIMSPDIDEKAIRHEDPTELVLAIARAKAEALKSKVTEPTVLITSDQVTVWNGEIREKPETEDEARRFLTSYAEYPAETVTAVVVTDTKTGKQLEGVDIAKMYFKPIPEDIVEKLIEEGDVMWCSGGFIGEHELLQPYIEKLEGDIDSIMGLPKKLTKALLDEISA